VKAVVSQEGRIWVVRLTDDYGNLLDLVLCASEKFALDFAERINRQGGTC
jgi:hypothetical protein